MSSVPDPTRVGQGDERSRLLELAQQWFPSAMRVYPYRDRSGAPVFLHIRIDSGDHPSKYRWVTVSADGTTLVPGKHPGETVVEPVYRYGQAKRRLEDLGPDVLYVCEGERDCDTLWDAGFIAVCSPDGASKVGQRIKWKDEYTEAIWYLRDKIRKIVVVADNDDPGLWTAELLAQVFEAARGIAVKRVYPVENGWDLTQLVEQGGSVSDLVEVQRFSTSDTTGMPPPPTPTDASPVPTDYGHIDTGEVARGGFGGFGNNDAGNQEFFAHYYADRVRFDWLQGRWLIFDGHRWAPDGDGHIYRLALEAVRRRLKMASNIPDLDTAESAAKWAASSLAQAKRVVMLEGARAMKPIADSGSAWDANGYLLGVGNGIVDLRDGRVREGLPEDRVTLWTDTYYHPDSRARRWEQFLVEVFGGDVELIDYLQRAVGYSFTGQTSEQVLFLCIGTDEGANGKGTLFRTLRAATGGYGYSLPFSALEQASFGQGNKAHELAELPGKRLVMASEAAEGKWFNTARVKALTGEDELNVQRKYGHPFTFRPVAKYWLAVNHPPKVSADEGAFWRRIRVLPFEVEFDPTTPEARSLEEELKGELPGILTWCIKGARRWVDTGLQPTPERVTVATQAYRSSQDPIAEYLRDHQGLEWAEQFWVGKSRLRQDYENYCRAMGLKPVTRHWKEALEKAGLRSHTVYDKEQKRNLAVWKGVRFK